MFRIATPAALFAPLLLALGSCTVYAPMQPSASMLSQARQAEFVASVQPTGRVEVTGAYSPVSHVLVTGGVSGSPRLGDNSFLVSRQYEVGAGLYQRLGQQWVLSGIGGFGQAYSHRRYEDLGLIFSGTRSENEASYHKLYGQLGLACVQPHFSYGVAYRLTQVNFNYLRNNREGEEGNLPLSSMTRHELALSGRLTPGGSRHWQLVGTVGLSVASTPQLKEDLGYPTYGRAERQANRNLLPAGVASLGVVYRLGPAGNLARR